MKIYIKSAVTLLSDEPYNVKQSLASDPDTSADVLDELADMLIPMDPALSYLCQNPNTSMETVLKLHNRYPDNTSIVDALVRRTDISPDMLDELASDYADKITVIDGVAENPNVATSTLIKLFEIRPKRSVTRLSLSKRKDVPTEVVSEILKTSNGLNDGIDKEDDVLLNILKNNELTPDQFERVYRLAYICSGSLHKVTLLLAESDQTPPEELNRIAASPYFGVKLAVYNNPNTPEETIERLNRTFQNINNLKNRTST